MRDHDLDAVETGSSGDFPPFQDLVAEAMTKSLRRTVSFFT
jgi:hypothetical protein